MLYILLSFTRSFSNDFYITYIIFTAFSADSSKDFHLCSHLVCLCREGEYLRTYNRYHSANLLAFVCATCDVILLTCNYWNKKWNVGRIASSCRSLYGLRLIKVNSISSKNCNKLVFNRDFDRFRLELKYYFQCHLSSFYLSAF